MKYLSAILIICISVLCAVSVQAGTLRVNTSIKPPFSTVDETGFFDLLLKEMGRRLGQEVELVRLPPERALVSISDGLSDVELPRIPGIDKKYPNLVMVDEKVIDYNFVAFCRGTHDVTDWNSLKGNKVGYLIGWKIFENNVPPDVDVYKLTKPDLMLGMLEKGRLDLVLYERYAGREQIRSHAYFGLNECKRPLAVKPMYMYFHKSHAELAKKATEVLRQMKKDGTYQRIMDETLH